jgi:hypothetical protein
MSLKVFACDGDGMKPIFINTPETILSPCRTYRYSLWREWIGGDGYVLFIGLNPSTADETNDDQTIRRCIGFAKAWGFAGVCMANLFAFRATDPKVMMQAADPVGRDNDAWLRTLSDAASLVVGAWGVGGSYLVRWIVWGLRRAGIHGIRCICAPMSSGWISR